MRYLGIDYGSKKVGIALSDEEGRIAFPHEVIENEETLLGRVAFLIRDRAIGVVVFGRSRDLDGTPNPIDRDIEAFAESIKALTGTEIAFEEEHYSSKEAERIQGRTRMTDASAAAILLNSYLSRTRSSKN